MPPHRSAVWPYLAVDIATTDESVDAIGSLRCDCRDQLEAALAFLGQQETGMLLYLRQEGRSIGFLY